jgi:hypothetical protein
MFKINGFNNFSVFYSSADMESNIENFFGFTLN